MKKKVKEVEVVAEIKSKLQLNSEKVAKQLNTNDIFNWIVIEGLRKFNQGDKLGRNMENFLTHIGVLEYK